MSMPCTAYILHPSALPLQPPLLVSPPPPPGSLSPPPSPLQLRHTRPPTPGELPMMPVLRYDSGVNRRRGGGWDFQ